MSAKAHNSDHVYGLAPVQFSRLTRRGVLLGLSVPQLIVLGVASSLSSPPSTLRAEWAWPGHRRCGAGSR